MSWNENGDKSFAFSDGKHFSYHTLLILAKEKTAQFQKCPSSILAKRYFFVCSQSPRSLSDRKNACIITHNKCCSTESTGKYNFLDGSLMSIGKGIRSLNRFKTSLSPRSFNFWSVRWTIFIPLNALSFLNRLLFLYIEVCMTACVASKKSWTSCNRIARNLFTLITCNRISGNGMKWKRWNWIVTQTK